MMAFGISLVIVGYYVMHFWGPDTLEVLGPYLGMVSVGTYKRLNLNQSRPQISLYVSDLHRRVWLEA